MRLKYYLRGLGIGIIVTTIILMISFSKKDKSMSDEEVIARATQLGMVMKEETGSQSQETETPSETEPQEPETPDASDSDEAPIGADGIHSEDAPEQGTADGIPEDAGAAENTPYILTIQSGDVCRVVCERLEENGVIPSAETLRKYLFEIGYASNMGTGDYEIPYGLTDPEVAEILKAGPIQ